MTSPKPPCTAVKRDGRVVSSCCGAEIEVTKDYTDTSVYVVTTMTEFDGDKTELIYEFVKTYDGTDGQNMTASCRGCLAALDLNAHDLQEG